MVKSKFDNAAVMLTITQQNQPVTQVLIVLKDFFCSQGGARFGYTLVN